MKRTIAAILLGGLLSFSCTVTPNPATNGTDTTNNNGNNNSIDTPSSPAASASPSAPANNNQAQGDGGVLKVSFDGKEVYSGPNPIRLGSEFSGAVYTPQGALYKAAAKFTLPTGSGSEAAFTEGTKPSEVDGYKDRFVESIIIAAPGEAFGLASDKFVNLDAPKNQFIGRSFVKISDVTFTSVNGNMTGFFTYDVIPSYFEKDGAGLKTVNLTEGTVRIDFSIPYVDGKLSSYKLSDLEFNSEGMASLK